MFFSPFRIDHQFHVNPPLRYLWSALEVVNTFCRKWYSSDGSSMWTASGHAGLCFHPVLYQSRLLPIGLWSDLKNEGTERLEKTHMRAVGPENLRPALCELARIWWSLIPSWEIVGPGGSLDRDVWNKLSRFLVYLQTKQPGFQYIWRIRYIRPRR